MKKTILTNCTVVTRTEMFTGTVILQDGYIHEIDASIYMGRGAIDLQGDLLLPGLIELHTDNLEKNIQPRPGVIWPSIIAATIAHDSQIIGAGITTVFDAVSVGGLRESSLRSQILNDSVAAISRGTELGLYKSDHFIHLRCEISDPRMAEMLNEQDGCPKIRLASIMDHTPGQRQWRDLSKWRLYHRDKNWTDTEAEVLLTELREQQQLHADRHRAVVVDFACNRKIPLASHDDTSIEDTLHAAAEGVTISEFPTTLDAAAKARELGLKTIMGAPNALRGVSHSGNIAASVLAEKQFLDGLSSDYVPSSLLHAAFHLAESLSISLPASVAMVSANIADMVNLPDRGEVAEGKIADLLQVKLIDKLPVLRKIWKRGVHVA